MTQVDLNGDEVRSKVIMGSEPREPLEVFVAGAFTVKVTPSALDKKLKLKKEQTKGDKERELKIWTQKRMKMAGSTAEPGDWDIASEAIWKKLCEML